MNFGLGQFTLQIPPWDARSHADLYADTLELAALADDAGFDSFWLAEHHGAADGYVSGLLPFLSAVAARTSRIELGTAVMLTPFHDPIRIAEDAAVVDNIAGGRLNLGLGLGWAPEEYRMFGAPTKGRGRRLAEFAQVLRAAFTQERFTFEGEHLSYTDVSVTPKPPRAIPIWLGGSAEPALRRAAQHGDGYFPPSTTGGPETLVQRAEEVLAIRRELGIDAPFRFGAFVPTAIGRDADEAWETIRDGVLHVRGSYMLWAQNERDVTKARDSTVPFADAVREGCLVGTGAQIAEALKPACEKLDAIAPGSFISAILVPPGVPRAKGAEQIERYANEVIAKLR